MIKDAIIWYVVFCSTFACYVEGIRCHLYLFYSGQARYNTALQSHRESHVTVHLKKKRLPPFGFARQYTTLLLTAGLSIS